MVQRGKPRARLVPCSGASRGAVSGFFIFIFIFLFCQIPHLREQGLGFSSLSPMRGCACRRGSMPRAASVLGNPNCSQPQARRGNIWVVCRIVCLTTANSSRAEAPQLPAPFARIWLGLRRGADPPGTGVAPCPRGPRMFWGAPRDRGCFGVPPAVAVPQEVALPLWFGASGPRRATAVPAAWSQGTLCSPGALGETKCLRMPLLRLTSWPALHEACFSATAPAAWRLGEGSA